VLDGQLYVVGGMPAYEAPDAPHHRVSGSVMRYSPDTNTWQTMKGEQQLRQCRPTSSRVQHVDRSVCFWVLRNGWYQVH
jgi:N-acetylneuraminic acid mutarotase